MTLTTPRFCIIGIFAALIILMPVLAAAHPHVFVASEAEVLTDDTTVTGIRQIWYFDEAFTAGILADYDLDGDSAFNEAESNAVENGAFINLQNFSFFTTIEIDGRAVRPREYSDFSVGVKDGMLYYAFTTPLHKSSAESGITFTMLNYDPEYYVDFYVGMGPKMHIAEDAAYTLNVQYEDDYSAANTMFMIPPVVATVTLTRK